MLRPIETKMSGMGISSGEELLPYVQRELAPVLSKCRDLLNDMVAISPGRIVVPFLMCACQSASAVGWQYVDRVTTSTGLRMSCWFSTDDFKDAGSVETRAFSFEVLARHNGGVDSQVGVANESGAIIAQTSKRTSSEIVRESVLIDVDDLHDLLSQYDIQTSVASGSVPTIISASFVVTYG